MSTMASETVKALVTIHKTLTLELKKTHIGHIGGCCYNGHFAYRSGLYKALDKEHQMTSKPTAKDYSYDVKFYRPILDTGFGDMQIVHCCNTRPYM